LASQWRLRFAVSILICRYCSQAVSDFYIPAKQQVTASNLFSAICDLDSGCGPSVPLRSKVYLSAAPVLCCRCFLYAGDAQDPVVLGAAGALAAASAQDAGTDAPRVGAQRVLRVGERRTASCASFCSCGRCAVCPGAVGGHPRMRALVACSSSLIASAADACPPGFSFRSLAPVQAGDGRGDPAQEGASRH
jgi:hypothetical protein